MPLLLFLPEVFFEDEISHKVDDLGLFILALIGIVWYRINKNRFSHSIAPVIFNYIGLAIKIVGIVLEIKDKGDIGDDFGGLILFLLSSLIITRLYLKSKELLVENK